MLLLHVILLALLRLGAAASGNARSRNGANLRSACDESFPRAPPPPPPDGHNRRGRRLVGIRRADDYELSEYYETGEYYAPLCTDGRRIDIRKLYRCNGGACWVESIGQCTFECTWNAPTPKPTPLPTVTPTYGLVLIETDNPLLFSLKNLPRLYAVDASVRSAIIQYLYFKLRNDLADMPVSMELVDLSYAGRLPGQPHDLPLNAKVRGPPDVSDFVLSYIQQLIEDFEGDIVENLKMMDDGIGGEAFKDLAVLAGTYSVEDVVPDTATIEPTNPLTKRPSTSPTPETKAAVILAAKETAIPWWVWLLVGVAILLCCICSLCLYRQRMYVGDEKGLEKDYQANMMVQTRRLQRPPSFAESFRARKPKPQRQSRSVPVKRSNDQTARSKRSTHTRSVPVQRSSDQTARTRRSTHTKKSRRPRSFDESAAPSAPVIAVPVDISGADWDTKTAVSALYPGFDPPEEFAIVPYDNYPDARDPTFYTNRAVSPDQVDPEGDVADASLMNSLHSIWDEGRRESKANNVKMDRPNNTSALDPNDVGYEDSQAYDRSERAFNGPEESNAGGHRGDGARDRSEQVLSEPEGVLSDGLASTRKNKKAKKKSRKKRESSSGSRMRHMGEMVRTSMKWKNRELQSDEVSDHSNFDSPSIATRPPRAEGQQHATASRGTYNDGYHTEEGGRSQSHSRASKKERKQKVKKNNSIFSSVTRKSSTFERDGVSSDGSY